MEVVIDSSVLVGLLNPADTWHRQANGLLNAMIVSGFRLVYFDCVAAEAISTSVRRLHEKGLMGEIPSLFQRLGQFAQDYTWILSDAQRLFPDVLQLMQSSSGALNFNDGLIALSCRERSIVAIASFDSDFDQLPWLKRISNMADIVTKSSS